MSAVDADRGIVTISMMTAGDKKHLAIYVSKTTVLRRYAPDSARFDEAIPGTLGQIKPGDQLRARGTRSSGENEIAADEVISGSFRNIAGTLESVDAAKSALSIMDLATEKPVTVKIAAGSQLKKLPPLLAQRLALRWKNESAAGRAGAGGEHPAAARAGENAGGATRGGALELQRVLEQAPAIEIAIPVAASSVCPAGRFR